MRRLAPEPPNPGHGLEPHDRVVVAEGIAFGMRWLPEGAFEMGALEVGAGDGEAEEHSVRAVSVAGHLLAATPVTQAVYAAVMGHNPSHFRGDDRPVESVSWYEAVRFCNALSARCGLPPAYLEVATEDWRLIAGSEGFRLPTEAEWARACRAGTRSAYWSGDTAEDLARVGWHRQNSGGETHPVGAVPASPWGLSDMHGNVWEWCHDWFGRLHASAALAAGGPAQGEERVIRGGSWDSPAHEARAASRSAYDPGFCNCDLGFRLARGPRVQARA